MVLHNGPFSCRLRASVFDAFPDSFICALAGEPDDEDVCIFLPLTRVTPCLLAYVVQYVTCAPHEVGDFRCELAHLSRDLLGRLELAADYLGIAALTQLARVQQARVELSVLAAQRRDYLQSISGRHGES